MKWHKAKPFTSFYCLASLEEAKAWAKTKKHTFPDIPEGSCGCLLEFPGRFIVVVGTHKNHWDVVDTIIHESVHVFQAIMSYAEETNAGSELQAYSIAEIATNILKDYSALHDERKAGLQKRVRQVPFPPRTN
jgi:hypothetical protein